MRILNIFQPRSGTEAGPSAILNSGLAGQLRSRFQQIYSDKPIEIRRNLPDPDYLGMKNSHTVSEATKHVSERVYEHSRSGDFVLTLGVDHSNAIGSLTGINKGILERLGRETTFIWVNAHVSMNTPDTSPSGYIHGMPLVFATGIAQTRGEGIFDWIHNDHLIDPKRIVYI